MLNIGVLGCGKIAQVRHIPEYAANKGAKLIGFYERYVRVLFDRYKGKVKYWLTFNEINNQSDTFAEWSAWTDSGILYLKFIRAISFLSAFFLNSSY